MADRDASEDIEPSPSLLSPQNSIPFRAKRGLAVREFGLEPLAGLDRRPPDDRPSPVVAHDREPAVEDRARARALEPLAEREDLLAMDEHAGLRRRPPEPGGRSREPVDAHLDRGAKRRP